MSAMCVGGAQQESTTVMSATPERSALCGRHARGSHTRLPGTGTGYVKRSCRTRAYLRGTSRLLQERLLPASTILFRTSETPVVAREKTAKNTIPVRTAATTAIIASPPYRAL